MKLSAVLRRGEKGWRALTVSALAALAAVTFSAPEVAHAGGFEYGTPGARGLGRGGAEVAGVDSPLALYYNPANLARMNNVRVQVGTNLNIVNTCMRRELVGGPTGYRPAAEGRLAVDDGTGRFFLPETCDDAPASLNPQVGVTIPVFEGFTIGAGLLIPVSSQKLNFTNADGSPAPTRYLVESQDIIQAFPTVSVGYAPIEQLRLGLGFGWGITHIDFTNYAFSSLGIDAPNTLNAMDGFVPQVTASVAATPVDGLDLAAAFTWTDDVKDSNADLDISVGSHVEPVAGVRLVSQQNWRLAFGARFADKLPGGSVDEVGDRLSTERWDVELDMALQGNKRVDSFIVDLPDDATVLGSIDLPDDLRLAHKWKNQLIVRLGGDYNPIPGVLGLRAGFSYESHGVTRGFEQLDFRPFERYGIHAGATVRFAKRFDVSVAYAHLFTPDIDNLGSNCVVADGVEPNCFERTSSEQTPALRDRAVANAGIIKSNVHMLAFDLNYAF